MDVNNAFLHGNIEEDIYMSQPPGFIHPQLLDHVCKFQKALYGLKQAPRDRFQALKQCMISIGFTNSKFDASLFVYKHDLVLAYFLVYVDDLLLTGNDPKFIQVLSCS